MGYEMSLIVLIDWVWNGDRWKRSMERVLVPPYIYYFNKITKKGERERET